MTDRDKIKAIQEILGVESDGIIGFHTRTAFRALDFLSAISSHPDDKNDHSDHAGSPEWHLGKASSFADPADVAAFDRCKGRGGTDQECFKVGDNGIGCWGDLCTQGRGPSCALPPDDMIDRWGSVNAAKHKLVEVAANGVKVTCVLRDRMPYKKNITNGAVIDLSPDAVTSLGMTPPVMISASWRWL